MKQIEKKPNGSDRIMFIIAKFIGVLNEYEFPMQGTRNMPERLCRVVNNPTKNNMVNVLFAWNDTKPARRGDSQLVALPNDENPVADGV